MFHGTISEELWKKTSDASLTWRGEANLSGKTKDNRSISVKRLLSKLGWFRFRLMRTIFDPNHNQKNHRRLCRLDFRQLWWFWESRAPMELLSLLTSVPGAGMDSVRKERICTYQKASVSSHKAKNQEWTRYNLHEHITANIWSSISSDINCVKQKKIFITRNLHS